MRDFNGKRSASGTNELQRMNEDSWGRRTQIDEDGKNVHEPWINEALCFIRCTHLRYLIQNSIWKRIRKTNNIFQIHNFDNGFEFHNFEKQD